MQGSLVLHRGTLFVGRHGKTAHVRMYDLDGHELLPGFSFRDRRLGRSVAAGLAVDDDRSVWVADTPSSRVRRFTLFGQEVGGLGLAVHEPLERASELDAASRVRQPVDVEVEGDSDGLRLTVVSGGERRHAVQVFGESGALQATLRPGGDPHGRFRGIRGVARRGELVFVAETGAARVQVFRRDDFHFHFAVPVRGGAFEPTAVAPLDDGRLVLTCGGSESALLLCGPGGELLRVLARTGTEDGAVFEPNDVVVDPGRDDQATRVAVIDRDGDRVQVFSLEGRCFGSFEERAG